VTRALRSLTNRTKLAISGSAYASVGDLLADCTLASADQLLSEAGGPVWTSEEFAALLASFRSALPALVLRTVAEVGEVLAATARTRGRLDSLRAPAVARSAEDMRAQIDRLTGPGFVSEAGVARLPELRRYLSAIDFRLEKASTNPARDASWMERVHRVEDEWAGLLEQRPTLARTALSGEIRWMLEDLRVSLFAQSLGTARGMSEQRIRRAIAELSATA